MEGRREKQKGEGIGGEREEEGGGREEGRKEEEGGRRRREGGREGEGGGRKGRRGRREGQSVAVSCSLCVCSHGQWKKDMLCLNGTKRTMHLQFEILAASMG